MADIATEKKRLSQIVLRIDDEHGHHIIRANDVKIDPTSAWFDARGYYTIEGYSSRPENYQASPDYFLPITVDEVKIEFQKQAKEWRYG